MDKKVLIICTSYHHKNTLKIANVLSQEMNAVVIEPKDFHKKMLFEYDIIGFGSGIYKGKHHKRLLELVNNFEIQNHKKAFVFSTSTSGLKSVHKNMNDMLIGKGFDIVDEFSCKGFINYSFAKLLLGGINKGRPNKSDCEEAKVFARNLIENAKV